MANNGKRYVLALDSGTTSTRAIIFDEKGEAVAFSQREFRQIYPRPGWVEHDPSDIIGTAREVISDVFARSGVSPDSVTGMGIANQRETVVAWHADTGKPFCNAVVWQCRRTADYCRDLERNYGGTIYDKTGLKPDAYFSASKIKWILDNVPQAREAMDSGKFRAGTVDSYLMYCLSGGKIFATDHTNASRTMLYDISKRTYDEELLDLFGITRESLPRVLPSGSEFGTLSSELLGAEIPVLSVLGDQQAALYGQRCYGSGTVKCTFGTGCFLLCNTGTERKKSKHGLLTTLASSKDGNPRFALEGSVFTGGAAIQWLRDEMKLISSAAESEAVANSVKSSGGVYVVPAFVGLGAPYWDSSARGLICGITRGTSREHVVRATLESVAYQTHDVFRAMELDTGHAFTRLAVDGGASANGFLMQFLADITGAEIVRPRIVETTALGVATLAARVGGADIVQSCDETVFVPSISEDKRVELLAGWNDAVRRVTL